MTEAAAHPNSAIHVLIVDDEEALRKAIVFDFKRKGYTTFDAENGAAALEIVKANRIDVVLTDVRMPVADGVQLLDWIKEINHRLPVVMFITGFTDLSIEDAFNKGAEAVFAKPFDRKALQVAVQRSLLKKEALWNPETPEVSQGLSPEAVTFVPLKASVGANAPDASGSRAFVPGRGGFFLALEVAALPKADAWVQFEIEQTQGPKIRGTGKVRWVRGQGSGNLRSGCGIELFALDAACRDWYLKETEAHPGRAFIPKQ
jgi:two-component system response regulator (stage 0 sporulation protein F)